MPVNTGLFPGEPVGTGLNLTGKRLPVNALLYVYGSVISHPVPASDEVYAVKSLGVAAGASVTLFPAVAGKIFRLNYIFICSSGGGNTQLICNTVQLIWTLQANIQYAFNFGIAGLTLLPSGTDVTVKNNSAGAVDFTISAGGTHQ